MFKVSIKPAPINLDQMETEIPCPRCRLQTHVRLGEIRRRDYVVCRGCYCTIHLMDHMGSVHRAQEKINRMLKSLEL